MKVWIVEHERSYPEESRIVAVYSSLEAAKAHYPTVEWENNEQEFLYGDWTGWLGDMWIGITEFDVRVGSINS